MSYTYPPAAPSLSGDTLTISRFLQNPTLVARRLRTILQQRYIADTVLSARLRVVGGAVQYETGESIFTEDAPRGVTPGAEYPLTKLGNGTASIAKTVKWGQDALVTDESIARRAMDPVERALLKLANQNVKHVDSVAMSAVASAVTAGANATASWATATGAQILEDVLLAKANISALNQGYEADTVVVDDLNYARAMAKLAAAGLLPRESANPVLTGDFPVIAGLRWLPTPNGLSGKALVVDSEQLGGMADEDLGGPGYVSAGGPGTAPVQVKTIREDENDQWRLRARRVTVPVVLEPAAGRTINSI